MPSKRRRSPSTNDHESSHHHGRDHKRTTESEHDSERTLDKDRLRDNERRHRERHRERGHERGHERGRGHARESDKNKERKTRERERGRDRDNERRRESDRKRGKYDDGDVQEKRRSSSHRDGSKTEGRGEPSKDSLSASNGDSKAEEKKPEEKVKNLLKTIGTPESLQAKLAAIKAKLAQSKGIIVPPDAKGANAEKGKMPDSYLLEDKEELRPRAFATLKINKRRIHEALKREKKITESQLASSKTYDPRMKLPSMERPARKFKFVEQGTYVKKAQRVRTKAQLEMLRSQSLQSNIDISALVKVEPEKRVKDPIPAVEWWDQLIMKDHTNYADVPGCIKNDLITHLVEHPVPIKPPAEPANPPIIPMMLTKKERRRLRKRQRQEMQREQQEQILLSLREPPKPRVRISNLMRVLGSEAVQDPTEIEKEVRRQMAERQRNHELRNQERKLSKQERKEKKRQKLLKDRGAQLCVAVFRIKDLSDGRKRFKVDVNAVENHMTGVIIMQPGFNIVIVEGGPKAIRRFRRLMLSRIDWRAEATQPDEDDEQRYPAANPQHDNACELVWEGTLLRPNFKFFKIEMCPTEQSARAYLRTMRVEHYYDMAKAHKAPSEVAAL